jgi:signal transduction histidine kinase
MWAGQVSLRSKSLLFLLGYTLALEGSILAFFYYSGRDAIHRRARQESRMHAASAKAAVEKALADSVAELGGLRAQLLLYPPRVRPGDAPATLIRQLVLGAPRKYAEIRLSDRRAGRAFAVRPVGEMGTIYAVAEEREDTESAETCAPDGPLPCVPPRSEEPRYELVRVVAPLDREGSRTLAADLHLAALLEPASQLAAPPYVSTLASTRKGLVLQSNSAALLRTYLPSSEPADTVAHRETIERLDVVLTARKDESPDLGELRLNLAQIASFTATLTLLSFAGVWALTGRMAASLRHIAEVADSVAAGDFSRRIDLRRGDELGALIDSFNGMTSRLEASYRELSALNRQLLAKVEELKRTRRRLSEKQRLAAVGEALSKISHEIQNKIGGAGVWVQNLERFGAKDENTRLCIAELKAALNSFLEMLVHFKRFYRAPQLERRRVPAGDLVSGSLIRVAAELEVKLLCVKREISEDMPLDVDPGQMTDVIVNILLNAAYFSPDRGTVHIAMRQVGSNVVLSFRDHGPGLPPKGKIFQPFFTTRESGSGLGLAIVRNVVHAHGGSVRAYNHAEGGACFEIRLPGVEAS